MKTKETLKGYVESFSELKEGWLDGIENEITVASIMTANSIIDGIPDDVIPFVTVHAMRDGGVQIDVGELREIEVRNYDVKEISFDTELNTIKTVEYSLK